MTYSKVFLYSVLATLGYLSASSIYNFLMMSLMMKVMYG